MNKKSFFGGVTVGVLTAVIAFGTLSFFPASAKALEVGNFTVTDKINYISRLLDKYYVDGIDVKELEEGIYFGLVDSVGDPYTTYLDAQQISSYKESISGAIQGIGVNVLADPTQGTLTVVSAIEGTPAEAAGLMSGDIIYKVDGKEVIGMDSDDVINMIKGTAGTKVTLVVLREDKEIQFQVERANIDIASAKGIMLENKIGYIIISGFKANTYEQFASEYSSLMEQGAKALIIDVRDNPGGMVDTVNNIADMLIPEGIIVYTEDKEGNRVDYTSDANSINIPLVLLVNGNSASASEILAGAVQDSGTGELIGTQTFGKGLVQDIFSIPDGSAVKITIQKYYTPNGICIHGDGITPDYVVDLEPGEVKSIDEGNYDSQVEKAIEVLKLKLN